MNETSEIEIEDSPYSNDEETKGFALSSGNHWYYPINYPIREYQYKIVETALYNNTLVCLPTGLGKTFIAAVVMYNFSRWYPRGKVVFMAPTRPLVAQQIHACHDVMGIPSEQTAELTGNINQKLRLEAWLKKRVIFATPQVFQNDLEHKNVPFNEVKCVVIDEAHKALGKHAYCEVIRLLYQYNKYFRVLALSATPGNSLDKVQEVVQNLHISNLELRDDTSSDIIPYINERKIDIVLVCLSRELQNFKDKYIEVMDPHVKVLISRGIISGCTANITKGRIFYLQKTLQENRNNNQYLQKTLTILLTMTHAYELLQKHGLRAFYNFYQNHSDKYWFPTETKLHALLEEIKEYLGEFPDIHIMPNGTIPPVPLNIIFGHTKFEKLKSILEQFFKNAVAQKKDSRSIVFVEFKDSVKEVFVLLLQCRPLIRPQMFMGQSDQKQKVQLQALQDFKNNKVNVLISTAVGEEGLDVGEVDLIVCFDGCQKNASRLVQRMGRTGRKRSGQIYILVTDGKEYKDLKSTLNKKDTFNNKVLQSSNIVSSMYQNNPRMVPSNFNPTCYKIRFESQPKTPQEVKRKRKAAPVERKKRMSKPKETSVQKSTPSTSTDFTDSEISQGNQFSMHKFLMKPKVVSKVSIQTIDSKSINGSDVKLLNDDELGLEFLTLMAIKDSAMETVKRESSIFNYLPQVDEGYDENYDLLLSYHPPPLEVFHNMTSWRREEVSILLNETHSEDEEENVVDSIYDDNNYSRSIIIQSPNLKYSRNEDIFDPRFPSDEAFNNITDNFIDVPVPTRQSINRQQIHAHLLNDGLDDQLEQTGIFDDIMNSSSDEENHVAVKIEDKLQENNTSNDKGNESILCDDKLNESCGIFDELMDSSSEEEVNELSNFKSSADVQNQQHHNQQKEIVENHVSEKPKSPVQNIDSDAVSQALLEIRNMSLGKLSLDDDMWCTESTTSRRKSPVFTETISSKNKELDACSSLMSNNCKDRNANKVLLSQNRVNTTRREIEFESDEDMFIDDDSTDNEMEKSINISDVPETPQKVTTVPNNIAVKSPVFAKRTISQNPSQNCLQKPRSLSLRLSQTKPKSMQIGNDNFDSVLENMSMKNNEPEKTTLKKSKLSLSNIRQNNPTTSSTSNCKTSVNEVIKQNEDDFDVSDFIWDDDFEPSSNINNTYFNSDKTQRNQQAKPKIKSLKLSQTKATSDVKLLGQQSNNLVKKSLSLNRISKSRIDGCSTSTDSDIENRRKNDTIIDKNDNDDDIFVQPKTPLLHKKPLMSKFDKNKVEEKFENKLKNHNEKVENRVEFKRNDTFYNSPCRKDKLAKKRYERQQKRQKNSKRGNEFLDDEAEVSIDVDTSDGSTGSDSDQEELRNFVSHTQYLDESHMQEVYLKTTRSPSSRGNFLIKTKEFIPKAMVCSQPLTQGIDEYVEDSFCVKEDEKMYEEDDEYYDCVSDNMSDSSQELSDLEQLELILEAKRRKKRKRELSADRPAKRKKGRRILYSEDESSEDEVEHLRRQVAE